VRNAEKEMVVKFEGHFHGVHDYLNFSNDVSSVLGARHDDGTIESLSGSAGIPAGLSQYIITISYNDIDTFCRIIDKQKDEIAGVILEPICLASAIMFPQDNFLNKIRSICSESRIVMIFDEVMSGFRENIGCAQSTVNVTPDIATFSKVLGGGFVISAIAGKKEYMNILDPIGDCVASGTNNGRLASVIAAYNTVSHLYSQPDIYVAHRENSTYFINSIIGIFKSHGVLGTAKGYGGRMVIYFGSEQMDDNYEYIVKHWDKETHMKCYLEAYKRGLYGFLMPLKICPEPICLTPAHTIDDINLTLNIFEDIVKNLACSS
jgi:glutamate-1-semialdehyde 2,1-aminomutase